jgi:hypothetical protein
MLSQYDCLTNLGTLNNRPIVTLFSCILAASAIGLSACEGDDGSQESETDTNTDTNTDTETGSDTDTDTETETECEPVEWGNTCKIDEPVANWKFKGIADADGDHAIGTDEQEEIKLALRKMHCAGFKSLVLMTGDTT